MLSIDPVTDAALEAALDEQDRRMVGRLEIDWDRDGLYSHYYSDLTDVLTECATDRSTATMLPPEINTLTGYSSGQLTATLKGRRQADELSMSELFDPYNEDSPLYNTGALLLPIRYSRVTTTAIGDVVLPVFTGFIRSAPFSRKESAVAITAGDHEDFQANPVTLPLWAVLTTGAYGGFSQSKTFMGAIRPSNLVWFVEEALRQAGRPATPVPRADAVAYHTCSGSMLPSVGRRVDAYQLPRVTVSNSSYTNPLGWIPGPYGLVPNEGNSTYNTYTATSRTLVPVSGSGSPQVNIGCSTFVKAVATAGSSSQYFYLDDYKYNNYWYDQAGWEDPDAIAGAIRLRVWNDGQVDVRVRETTTGMPGGSRIRDWSYIGSVVVGSWHHYNLIVKFTGSNIVPELRVDGVIKTLTASGSNPAASGYRYRVTTSVGQAGGTPPSNRPNVVRDESPAVPHCHAQWYVGNSSTDYDPNQVVIPTMPNGKPYAVVGNLLGEAAWVPDVDHAGAWNVLKDIMSAEYGILWIDEYGTVRVAARSTAQNITTGQLSLATPLTDDQLDELVVLPTLDSKRNTIVASWGFRGEIESEIYTQQSATERPTGPSDVFSSITPTQDVTAISPEMVPYPADPTGVDYTQKIVQYGWVSAVQAANLSIQASPNWGTNVLLSSDSRSFNLVWSGNGTEDIFIGSMINGNQPNLGVAGRKYSELQTSVTTRSDAADVALYGTRALHIGGTDWFQTPAGAQAIADNLLVDTVHPAPMIENIKVPADPRRQLFDILRLTNETGSSGVLFGQILSKTTNDTGADMTDTLTLRIVNTPNTWLLGITGASELGSTTILS